MRISKLCDVENGLILVSHSGKQYVHRVVQALLSNRYSVLFCNPIWFQSLPSWLAIVPSLARKKISGELKKRLFAFKGKLHLVTYPFIMWRKEIMDRIPCLGTDYAQLNLEKNHDGFAANQVSKFNPQFVIGYEISSVRTFQVARSKRIVTVLDLAQIHYQDIFEIAERFPAMHYILQNNYLKEINSRKQAEYESADFILTLSSYARQSLLKRGFSADRVYEVNLGIDIDLFTPKPFYQEREELRLLICGTDMVRKGLGLLIEVLRKMKQGGYKLHLTIVGPQHEVNKALELYGHPANITVLEFMQHEDLVKQYQEADLFVFPSYLDSWAMTVLEAMACGTPVIVTENTGSKDAVQKGGGIIVPAGDVTSLEGAINKFYNQRHLLEQMGKKARQVSLGYTWDNYNKQLNYAITEMENRSKNQLRN